jgi:CO/xanthine dehydrogenase Mo-binding subunit
LEENCFVSDIILSKMLHALTVRSPVAKGRLVSVECPALPDGYSLLSAKDIPGKNRLDDADIPILADEELSYIGEPVALLLGPDINILEDRIRNCKVIAEEAPPVFQTGGEEPAIIAAKREFSTGDINAAFIDAVSIVNGDYMTGIQEHWYAEPCGAVSWPEQGKIAVRTATQWPSHVTRSVCGVLGVPASKVMVTPTITGLHMDGKLWYASLVSCHAALGAWISKQPVRLILTGEEDFCFSPKRFGIEIHFSSAINEKGEISGLDINAVVNLGSRAVNANEILEYVNLGSTGGYKIKNIRFNGIAIKTNIPPQGPLAGYGLAQGFFALESHISYIADSIGQDPAQWRKQNFHTGPMGQSGSSNKGSTAKGAGLKSATTLGNQLIDNVINISDYRRKWAAYEVLKTIRKKNSEAMTQEQGQSHRASDSHLASWMERTEGMRGIGIAMGYQDNGLNNENAAMYPGSVELTLNKEGILDIKTSMIDIDHGIWAGLASKILEIDKRKVRTSYNADSRDSGPSSSRNIAVLTKLVEQACRQIQKKKAKDGSLPITVRKTTRPPQKTATTEEQIPKGVADPSNFFRLAWASAVVEVEFDPIGYMPRIRGVWMCVDGGKILSENKARKNLKISIVQALGWAYKEQISYIDGAIPVDQFDNFDIPGLGEIPPIVIEFIKSNSEEPKGIGDLPFCCIPAAFVQAVSQAVGCHFRSIPLKVQNIFSAGRLA